MTARLVENMDFQEYLDHPALSASGMKHLLDSPARFQWERQNPTDTPTLLLGRLIHALAFDQPHTYVVKDWDGRTKEGKARAAEVTELGLEFVSDDDWTVAEGIAKALKANEFAHAALYSKGARHEVSAFWTDNETGIELKARFDTLHSDGDIGDLKSTINANPRRFIRDAAKFGYITSAAHYRAASKALYPLADPTFTLVAAEKKPPHFLSVVRLNEYDLQLGEGLRRKAIRLFVECTERDHWPDYTEDIAYPDAPAYWRIAAEEAAGLYEIEVA